MKKEVVGKSTSGQPVELFTLTNNRGMSAKFLNYGTILKELHVPDRTGTTADVVLGFDGFEHYLEPHPYFGCIAGRFANRIKNGKFSLDGKQYQLVINTPPHHLHGGSQGLDKKFWNGRQNEGESVVFCYTSPDGEEGYPGNLQIEVTCSLSDNCELKLDYKAVTDKPTPVNLTNHSYFNLKGESVADILDNKLTINASHYTTVDDSLIPTGEIAPVKGTPLDFMQPSVIGSRIGQVGIGYDHNFVLGNDNNHLVLAARVKDTTSGRVMEVFTTEPGIQVYTANFLDGSITGKNSKAYPKHSAICLETQHYPDSVNQPGFPSTILYPGKTFKSTTIYKFKAE
jgi:aldose 1-epimerase